MSTELIVHYGAGGVEDTRLRRSPHGRLEFLRTQELIRRWLPGSRSAGRAGREGATGIHAAWPAADGYSVHVIDPVPAHVEAAARIRSVTA